MLLLLRELFFKRGPPSYLLTTCIRVRRGRGLTRSHSIKEISPGWCDMSFPACARLKLKDNKGGSQTLHGVDVQLLRCWPSTTPVARLRLGSQEPGTLLRHIKWEMDWLISQCQLVMYTANINAALGKGCLHSAFHDLTEQTSKTLDRLLQYLCVKLSIRRLFWFSRWQQPPVWLWYHVLCAAWVFFSALFQFMWENKSSLTLSAQEKPPQK